MGYSISDKINDDIRLSQKRKTIKKGGTFIERELYQSEAFMSLRRAFSVQLLILFLDKRIRESTGKAKDRKGRRRELKFVNLDNINMPYSELEKKYGVPRQTITRALDEILSKGFIEIQYQGGAYHHDKSVYALVDKWMMWKPGMAPFSIRQPDVKRGYQQRGKNISRAQIVTPIHAQIVTPDGHLGVTDCYPTKTGETV
jgi:hypothetical protein